VSVDLLVRDDEQFPNELASSDTCYQFPGALHGHHGKERFICVSPSSGWFEFGRQSPAIPLLAYPRQSP